MKYDRNKSVNWITVSGFILIAAGMFLGYIGQNVGDGFDDKHFRQSISEKTSQIDKLLNNKNELLAKIDEYQNSLSKKDEIIQKLETIANKSDVPVLDISKKSKDEKAETSSQIVPEKDFSVLIAQARSLCGEGRYDEAYNIANYLRQNDPDFGPAYFILGTIEMRREHYGKGEKLLNRAVQLKLPDMDKALAFNNLGTSSARKMKFKEARVFLLKALELNPNMAKSKEMLNLVDQYFAKDKIIEQAWSLCVEGKNDDAYRIADHLRQEHPKFGPVHFILGMIEMYRENYGKGEKLLNHAIQLGLSDEDMAWTYHFLGYSSLQKQDLKEARGFLEKAVELNPNMEESKKALNLLDELD